MAVKRHTGKVHIIGSGVIYGNNITCRLPFNCWLWLSGVDFVNAGGRYISFIWVLMEISTRFAEALSSIEGIPLILSQYIDSRSAGRGAPERITRMLFFCPASRRKRGGVIINACLFVTWDRQPITMTEQDSLCCLYSLH